MIKLPWTALVPRDYAVVLFAIGGTVKKTVVGLASLVLCSLFLLVPLAAQANADTLPPEVPPACVEFTHESGLHLQLGYAPNGHSDCQQLP